MHSGNRNDVEPRSPARMYVGFAAVALAFCSGGATEVSRFRSTRSRATSRAAQDRGRR
jgi:hypothetical protein